MARCTHAISMKFHSSIVWAATGAERYMILSEAEGGGTFFIGESDGTRAAIRAAVRRHLAGDQAEQGRFARAVATDQRDAMALGNGDGGVVEDHTPAEAESQFIDVQHAEAGDSMAKAPF